MLVELIGSIAQPEVVQIGPMPTFVPGLAVDGLRVTVSEDVDILGKSHGVAEAEAPFAVEEDPPAY